MKKIAYKVHCSDSGYFYLISKSLKSLRKDVFLKQGNSEPFKAERLADNSFFYLSNDKISRL